MGRQGKRSRTDLALPPKVFGAPRPAHTSRSTFFPPAEAWFWTETPRLCVTSARFLFLFLFLFWLAVWRPSVGVLWGTCRAPRVIAPWRGELEWFPVSNPALCRVVDMREDGRSQRLFRGRLVYFSWQPPGAPIWGFTAHVGGRAPSRVHIWVSPIFSYRLFLSSLPACVSVEALPVLYCFVFTAVLLTCCVY